MIIYYLDGRCKGSIYKNIFLFFKQKPVPSFPPLLFSSSDSSLNFTVQRILNLKIAYRWTLPVIFARPSTMPRAPALNCTSVRFPPLKFQYSYDRRVVCFPLRSNRPAFCFLWWLLSFRFKSSCVFRRRIAAILELTDSGRRRRSHHEPNVSCNSICVVSPRGDRRFW